MTSRTNADGRVVRYVALAHNPRVDGRIKPDVLMNLGRVDQVDVAGPLEVVDARTIGSIWLLDQLRHRLDVATAVRAATDARRFTTNMERVLFALMANRAVAPMSKLSAADWASQDAAIPGLSTMDEDHAYRAMDLLADADTTGRVQESVFFAVANLLNLEVDLLFFDTTSTYFERDDEEQGVTRRSAGSATPRTTTPTCRRSSLASRSLARGSRCGAGAGPATPTTSRCWPRSETTCATGNSAGSSPSSTAASPPPTTSPTCVAPVGTTSPACACVTATRSSRPCCRGRAARHLALLVTSGLGGS